MNLKFSYYPHQYNELYRDEVANHPIFFNPLSSKGIVVLNQESEYILSLINGRRSIDSIYRLAKSVDSSVSPGEILGIVEKLLTSNLIYFNHPSSRLEPVNIRDNRNDGKLLRIWIHLTNECNLRCIYCFVGKTTQKMDVNLGIKSLKKIINEAKSAGYEEIVCNFGGGEPLLEWDNALSIVRSCKNTARKINIPLRFGLITNATLLTDKIAKTLKRENMFVAVSMDGLGKYQNIQRPYVGGGDSFQTVNRGIEILIANNIVFNLITIITSKNVSHLPEFTRHMLKLGIPISFGFYKDSPHSKSDLNASPQDLIKYFKLVLKEISLNPPSYTIMHGLLDMVALDYPHIHPCRAGRHYLVLRHDGRLAFCSVSVDRPIGNPRENDSIIEMMRRNSLLRPKTRTINDVKECRYCPWKYSCCGGCPLVTYEHKGTYNSNSPLCSVFKKLLPELLRTEAKRLLARDPLVQPTETQKDTIIESSFD